MIEYLGPAMFLLYHSDRCNTSETVFHWCYVNDLHTTRSGMLGHHMDYHLYAASSIGLTSFWAHHYKTAPHTAQTPTR
jgi:hypothetical protein